MYQLSPFWKHLVLIIAIYDNSKNNQAASVVIKRQVQLH
jgi:hypothetical protein